MCSEIIDLVFALKEGNNCLFSPSVPEISSFSFPTSEFICCSMDMRVLLFLLVVSSYWSCNARDLTADRITGKSKMVSGQKSYYQFFEEEAQHEEKVSKNENLCSLCEEFSADAVNYLSQNKTQTEIISILHKSCSRIPTFKEQCIVLVDYYAPLFFLEVSSIEPSDFCRKVGLCQEAVSIFGNRSTDKCDLCHSTVTEALSKLQDPDTELEIVELLLKACNSVGKNIKKCKRLVFEYTPIILTNAEQFLETNDVCTILHACDSTAVETEQSLMETETSLHSAS